MRIDKYKREVKLEKKGGETPFYPQEKRVICDAFDAMEFALDILSEETEEVFVVIALTEAHEVIGYREISRGTYSKAEIETLAIFQFLMLTNSKTFIVAHNHLSYECEPSDEDNRATRRIERCSKLLEVNFLDHIIVSQDGAYSYEDHGFFDELPFE